MTSDEPPIDDEAAATESADPALLDELARRVAALRVELAAIEKVLAAATTPIARRPRLRWLRGGLWGRWIRGGPKP